MFQELADANIEEFRAAGVDEDPHGLPALPEDDRRRTTSSSASRPRSSTRRCCSSGSRPTCACRRPTMSRSTTRATWRAMPGTSTSRASCWRGSAPRCASRCATGTNPFCCGAGGGLLFEEHEEGKRISQERFEQLQATGAGTIVTACPFCSIMLKGAQASANATTQVVDLMTYVDGRLKAVAHRRRAAATRLRAARAVNEPAWRASPAKRFEAAAIAARRLPPRRRARGARYRWQRRRRASTWTRSTRAGRQPILALWHGRILPAIPFFRDRGVVAITSENFDGEWIARIMRRFGYAAARGSTSRGGKRGAAADEARHGGGAAGPRSPWTARAGRRTAAQPGAVWLAKATGNPVVPFHIEAERRWIGEELGPRAGAEAVEPRRDRHRRAAVRPRRRGRGGDRGARQTARASARAPCRSERCDDRAVQRGRWSRCRGRRRTSGRCSARVIHVPALLVHSDRFADHAPPPGHAESVERAKVCRRGGRAVGGARRDGRSRRAPATVRRTRAESTAPSTSGRWPRRRGRAVGVRPRHLHVAGVLRSVAARGGRGARSRSSR